MKICSVEGCDHKECAKGLCNMHYKRKQLTGKVERNTSKNVGECIVDGCTQPQETKNFCVHHYNNFYRYGEPTKQLFENNINKVCKVCGIKPAYVKLMCDGCYRQEKRRKDLKFKERRDGYARVRRAKKHGALSDKWTKVQIIEKSNGICALCGELIDMELKYPNRMSFSIDHIIPLNKGGSNLFENVQAAHLGCNCKKQDNLEEII